MNSSYQSNLDFEAAANMLRQAKRVVIATHAKPDGDAFGSVIALSETLTRGGAEVTSLFMPPIPPGLALISGDYPLALFEDEDQPLPEADLYVVVDTGAWSQVHPLRKQLEPCLHRTLIIDHHLNGDIPAAYRLIDGQAAACCELIAQLVTELDSTALEDRLVADSLYLGIATDTGWFRFSNTRPQTHELAAKLIAAGVDHAALYERTEQTERPQKLKLMIRALDSLELLGNDQAAIMVLKKEDFEQTDALSEETERFVDLPQMVSTVQVVVLISETLNGGSVRVSFRSKPGPNAINVAAIAQQFGGGGHARAAGLKMDLPVDDVALQIKQAVQAAVSK